MKGKKTGEHETSDKRLQVRERFVFNKITINAIALRRNSR